MAHAEATRVDEIEARDGDRDEREGDVSDWSWRRREWWNLGRVICCRVWGLRHELDRCKFGDATSTRKALARMLRHRSLNGDLRWALLE
jgi:hypothetical protein